MRLKHVKGSTDKIERHINTIQDDTAAPLLYKGKWRSDIFKNNNPLHIEIGMGKGKFILEMAKKFPDVNFIGVEKYSSVLVRAIERLEEWKAENDDANTEAVTNAKTVSNTEAAVNSDASESGALITPYKNLIFLRLDAENIDKYFEENELDMIHLNFSDPWPKKRHEKRRLTSSYFLEKYRKILKPDGKLRFKTDNTELFEFSVKSFEKEGWILETVNRNLHENGPAENNVMTEYEQKFYELHKPINLLESRYEIKK